jgi:hypothetical protein
MSLIDLTGKQLNFDYGDVPTIWRFANDNTFMRVLMGPWGSGKSTAGGVVEILRRAGQQKPWLSDGVRRTRWAVARASNRKLEDTTIKTWEYWIKKFGDVNWSDFEKTKKNLNIVMTGEPDENGKPTTIETEINFRQLDDEHDVDNLLSTEYTGAHFNELKEIEVKQIWDDMSGRVGRYPPIQEGGPTWCGIWGDTNPPDTDHWIYKLFEEDRPLFCPVCKMPDGGAVLFTPREVDGKLAPPVCPVCGREEKDGLPATVIFKQPSGRGLDGVPPENIKWLRPGYYTNLMVGKDPSWITANVDGRYSYVRDGRPVYPLWNDLKHLAVKDRDAHPSYPLVCGWDCTGNKQGFSINQQFPDAKFRTYDEIYLEDTDSKTFLENAVMPYMRAVYPGWPWSRVQVIIDPAAKRSDSSPTNAVQESRNLGIQNVVKAFANNWDARFGAVNRLLLMNQYELNPRCKILHRGFLGEYRVARKRVSNRDVYKDEPEKNKASHLHDSLQYAAEGPERGGYISTSSASRDHSQGIGRMGAFT